MTKHSPNRPKCTFKNEKYFKYQIMPPFFFGGGGGEVGMEGGDCPHS